MSSTTEQDGTVNVLSETEGDKDIRDTLGETTAEQNRETGSTPQGVGQEDSVRKTDSTDKPNSEEPTPSVRDGEDEDSDEAVGDGDETATALGITVDAVKEYLGDDYDEDADVPLSYKALPKSARTALIDLYKGNSFSDEDATTYGKLWADNIIGIAYTDVDDSSKTLLSNTLSMLAAEQLKAEYKAYSESSSETEVVETQIKEYEQILTPEYSSKIDSIMNTIDQRYRGDFDDFVVDKCGDLLDKLSASNADQFVEALQKAKDEFNSSSYKYGRLTQEAGKTAAVTQAYIDALNTTLAKAGATGRVLNHTEPRYLETIKAAEGILSRAGINLGGTKEYSEFYKVLRSANTK